MHRRFCGAAILATILSATAACPALPPALTGVTIFPSDAEGWPLGDAMCRTRLQPPIPVIGIVPGADPLEGGRFWNDPRTGRIAITLTRGIQNFTLFTALPAAADHFAIAIYLDGEPMPALSSVVTSDSTRAVVASRAAVVMGLDGEPVANRSSTSAIRDGYHVSLVHASFPLAVQRLDMLSPWLLQPDNIADAVGVITLDVQPVTSAS